MLSRLVTLLAALSGLLLIQAAPAAVNQNVAPRAITSSTTTLTTRITGTSTSTSKKSTTSTTFTHPTTVAPITSTILTPISTSTKSTTTTRSTSTTTHPNTTLAPTTSTIPTTTYTVSTTTGCYSGLRPRATGPPIYASTNGTAVTNLELQDTSNVATLTSFGLHQGWSFANGGLAKFEWSFTCWAYKYLNIGTSTASYKPLTFSYTKLTSDWVVPSGGDIGTSATSVYGVVTDFLACQEGLGWVLYLQTGTDLPGSTCALTKLRVG